MTSVARWQHAQQYERGYWESLAASIAAGSVSQLDWYRWRAEQLAHRLAHLGLGRYADGSARVVEIGSGPIGIVSYFPAAARIAVDPLEPFYGGSPVLTALRSSAVCYRQGVGEALPCDAASFDLAIIENCIDHVRDVDAVMRELARVLRPGGIVYLTCNCRTRWGFVAHRLLSRLHLDAGHPHTFTPRRFRALVQAGAFRMLSFEAASYREALKGDLKGPGVRARLKGVLGISEFLVTALAQRAETPPE